MNPAGALGCTFAGSLKAAETGGLGRDGKSCPLVDFEGDFPFGVDVETGEVFQDPKAYDPVSTRLERFALQSAARRILPSSSTAKCLRFRRKDKTCVEVYRSLEHGTAHFGGLQTCSSVWACPICAAKISERRKPEILQAMDSHKADGGEVRFITLTNPHYFGDSLPALLVGQQKAMHRFNSTKAALAMWDWMGCIGTVRAWEVTYGQNGWHPHFHMLAFVRSGIDLDEARRRLYEAWAAGCRLAGLPVPPYQIVTAQGVFYPVDIQDGSKAEAYVTKGLWGLEHEMTKGHMKKAKSSKGRSPFDLLRSYLYDDDRQAAALFKVYADAFHGKRQLVWSKGLKDHFGIVKTSDPEIASSHEDTAELLGKIELEDWRLVLKFDLRGEVLELACHGWEPVRRLLSNLRKIVMFPKYEKTRFHYRE